MTTTQPAALPELPEGVTLEDLLIPLRAALSTCHDTDWSLRQFKTHITHALAALQPQPAAAVSDAEIDTVIRQQRLAGWFTFSDDLRPFARAILALRPQAVPMTLPPVEGDVLPAIGSKVLIHLASSDSWAEHEVVGYYVWEAINELAKPRHHRVFVRVRDTDGILNARHICDLRGITAQGAQGEQA